MIRKDDDDHNCHLRFHWEGRTFPCLWSTPHHQDFTLPILGEAAKWKHMNITTLHHWCCNLIYTFQLYSTTTFEIAQDFLRTGLEVWGECDNGWRWRVAWSGLMEVMTRSLVLGPHVMQKPPWPWPRQVLGQPLTSILCWWSGVSVAICSYTTRPPCVLRTAARSKMISGAARNKLLVQTKYPFTLMVMTSNMVGEGDDFHGRVCR